MDAPRTPPAAKSPKPMIFNPTPTNRAVKPPALPRPMGVVMKSDGGEKPTTHLEDVNHFQDWMEHHFGTTSDPTQAAFLSPNGQWYKGRAELAANPMRDHQGIAELALRSKHGNDVGQYLGSPLHEFLRQSGMIRVNALPPSGRDQGLLSFEVGGPISPEQKQQLHGASQKFGDTQWRVSFPGHADYDPDLTEDYLEWHSNPLDAAHQWEGTGINSFLAHAGTQHLGEHHDRHRAETPQHWTPAQTESNLVVKPTIRPLGDLPHAAATPKDFALDSWAEKAKEKAKWMDGLTKTLRFLVRKAKGLQNAADSSEIRAILAKALPEKAYIPQLGSGISHQVRTFLRQNPQASSGELTALRGKLLPKVKPQDHHDSLSMDDIHALFHAGLDHKDWYHEFADHIEHHIGEHNMKEFAAVMGPTSAQAPPITNFRAAIRVMRAVRVLAQDPEFKFEGPAVSKYLMNGKGNLVDNEGVWKYKPNPKGEGWIKAPVKEPGRSNKNWSASDRGPDLVEAHNPHYQKFWDAVHPWGSNVEKNPTSSYFEPVVQKLWELYSTGTANIPSTPKTSAYTSNLMSAYKRLWDPFATVDTWASKPAGMVLRRGPKGEAVNRWYGKAPIESDHENEYVSGFYEHLAEHYGLTPHQVQAAVWMSTKAIGDMFDTKAPLHKRSTSDPDSPVADLIAEAREKGLFGSGSPTEAVNDPYNARFLQQHGDLLRAPSPGMAADATLRHVSQPDPIKKDPTRVKYYPRPVSREIAADARADAMTRSPSLMVPLANHDTTHVHHSDSLHRLGYDPVTKRLAMLDGLNLDHEVSNEIVHTANGPARVPHVDVKIVGAGRQMMRYVASLIGHAGDLDHVRMHSPSLEDEDAYGGIRLHAPGVPPEHLHEMASAMGQHGIHGEVQGDSIRFPDYQEQGQDHHDAVLAAAQQAGIPQEGLVNYAGYTEELHREDYEDLIAELAPTYGRSGRPGLSGGWADQYGSAVRGVDGPENPQIRRQETPSRLKALSDLLEIRDRIGR